MSGKLLVGMEHSRGVRAATAGAGSGSGHHHIGGRRGRSLQTWPCRRRLHGRGGSIVGCSSRSEVTSAVYVCRGRRARQIVRGQPSAKTRLLGGDEGAIGRPEHRRPRPSLERQLGRHAADGPVDGPLHLVRRLVVADRHVYRRSRRPHLCLHLQDGR